MESTDQWRFTPIFEHNSFGFTPSMSHSAGLFGLSPGALNPAYHSQAGDLHTPGLAQLGTPLSMPHTETTGQPVMTSEMHGFHPQLLAPEGFNNHHIYPQQPSYAPSSFIQAGSHFHSHPHGVTTDATMKHTDMKFAGHSDVHSLAYSGSNLQPIATMPAVSTLETWVRP